MTMCSKARSSFRTRDNKKWVAPSKGGYSASSESGRVVPRPSHVPKNPPSASSPKRG